MSKPLSGATTSVPLGRTPSRSRREGKPTVSVGIAETRRNYADVVRDRMGLHKLNMYFKDGSYQN